MLKISLALLLWCAAAAFGAGQTWSTDDVWNWRAAADPRISPDGKWVVYAERWNDRASSAACANLWLVSIANKQLRRLTDGPWLDQSPRWSGDSSRLAWLSGRGGIHVLELPEGKEIAVAMGLSPQSLAWSSDGKRIAFRAAVPAQVAAPAWAPAAILPWLWPRAVSRNSLFVMASAGGPALPITGADLDAAGEPAWMPDGKFLLTAASDGEIYALQVADGSARRLTENTGRNQNPVPSPDGAKIAWLATDSRPSSYTVRKLYVMNADGGRAKVLAGALDRDPSHPQWSSDSRTIYFTAEDSGSTHVYAARADGSVRQVTRAVERLRGFSLADDGHAATVRANEVVSFTVDLPPVPVVLAAPAAKLLAERDTGAAEELHFPSGGRTIQGWLVKPPGFEAARKYPLLLDIEDAPRRMVGPEFSLRAQVYAARGWLVLRANPRGTPGFGEQFGRLLPSRFPGDDADDLLAAVDFVVSKGYVDSQRLAVRGGLVAAWLLGHSNRFAAVVARRAIVDFAVDAAHTAPWMGAMPWENPDQFMKHSPIYFAQEWKSPTLILAGERDPQADEFYFALQQRKVKSAMVRSPDNLGPAGQVVELEAALAWLQQYASGR